MKRPFSWLHPCYRQFPPRLVRTRRQLSSYYQDAHGSNLQSIVDIGAFLETKKALIVLWSVKALSKQLVGQGLFQKASG